MFSQKSHVEFQCQCTMGCLAFGSLFFINNRLISNLLTINCICFLLHLPGFYLHFVSMEGKLFFFVTAIIMISYSDTALLDSQCPA